MTTYKTIYPTKIEKYTGEIIKNKDGTFVAKVDILEEIFNSYIEATMWLKEWNIENKLPIQNIITIEYFNGKYIRTTMKLTLELCTEIDIKDIALAESFIWIAEKFKRTNLVSTTLKIKRKKIQCYFHRMKLFAIGTNIVKHIDLNGLNNTSNNLHLIIKEAPLKGYIYSFSLNDNLLYIGCATNMYARLIGHTEALLDKTTKDYNRQFYSFLRQNNLLMHNLYFKVVEEIKYISKEHLEAVEAKYIYDMNPKLNKIRPWNNIKRKEKDIKLLKLFNYVFIKNQP